MSLNISFNSGDIQAGSREDILTVRKGIHLSIKFKILFSILSTALLIGSLSIDDEIDDDDEIMTSQPKKTRSGGSFSAGTLKA